MEEACTSNKRFVYGQQTNTRLAFTGSYMKGTAAFLQCFFKQSTRFNCHPSISTAVSGLLTLHYMRINGIMRLVHGMQFLGGRTLDDFPGIGKS